MESMKKLFFAVTNDLNSDQRMLRICNSLSDAGYQVHLRGRLLPESRPLNDRVFEQSRMKLFFTKGPFFYLEYNLRIFLFALTEKADLLSAVDLDTLPGVRLAAILLNKLFVYDAHEIFTEVPELLHSKTKQGVWRWIERIFLWRVKHSYTVNHSLAQWYFQKHGLEMRVVRNMPFRCTPPTIADVPPFILYQGALNEGRGLEALIEAMQFLPMPLMIAGRGDLDLSLRSLSKRLQLDERVNFLGQLEPEALQQLTQQAWLGVNLLEDTALNYYLSLANKFFDYVQAHVPQLCMDFPEYNMLNETHAVAILIRSLDPNDLADYILRLQGDSERYTQLQNNCKVASEVWVWENECEALLAVYAAAFARK